MIGQISASNQLRTSSELARNMFGASSELAPNMFGASSELASVMEFGFKLARPPVGILETDIRHLRVDPASDVFALAQTHP